jgi:hypothetical protein
MTNKLHSLIRDVLALQISQIESCSEALSKQLKHLQSINVELTGVGFYAKFILDEKVEAVTEIAKSNFGGVQAEIPGVKNGCGFVLFVENGKIDTLEGYTYDEPWPSHFETYTLSRTDPN